MARSAPYIGTGGSVDLDPNVFEEPFHPSLVHEAVRAERNARRRGTA
jgi:ribosomal protein L4